MDYLYWIIIGLVAGALGKLLMPGDDPGGIFVTILLGIAGAVVGGYIGKLIGVGDGSTIQTLITATGGTILLLTLYRLYRGKKLGG